MNNNSLFSNFRNNLSSLRHPDGASNPNLRDVCKREPGNGAESIPKVDDEDDISVPPPLQSSMLSLNRDSFESKSQLQNSLDLNNGQLHDPGGKDTLVLVDIADYLINVDNSKQIQVPVRQRINHKQFKFHLHLLILLVSKEKIFTSMLLKK
ncbi:hypothetical protein O3M35_007221 [Rhynocoris fuscipes]|uniref:Uncharacterized protein n=1 Tax=Rhynocoris fuscipes TaxID=488301 RepID=A0AAW1DG13_9HEMI